MTTEKVIDFLNKLEGFKTTSRNQHWDSKKDSEHHLMQEVEFTIGRFQDSIAEIYQGIYDIKIQPNKLQGKTYKFSSYPKYFKDLLKCVENFYLALGDNKKYIGLKSKLEEFLANINQFAYRITMCINESRVKQIIREGLLKYGKLI